MQPDFWLQRWHSGHIGFHQPEVEHALTRHWAHLELAADARVFVPLCGKSLDLIWLRDRGHHVSGVELSAVALEAFCLENGIAARRSPANPDPHAAGGGRIDFDRYEAPCLDLWCGDFFALTPGHLGHVAGVYDRASLVSWQEDRRAPYVRHMTELTPRGARTLLITLEYAQAQMAGPPFSVPAAEVRRLYGAHHLIEECERRDVLSSEPRMRGKGVTALHQVCYRLTRR